MSCSRLGEQSYTLVQFGEPWTWDCLSPATQKARGIADRRFHIIRAIARRRSPLRLSASPFISLRGMGWTAGIRFPAGASFVYPLQRPDWFWGPTSLWAIFLAVKGQKRKADYSLPSNAEITNDGAVPPLPIPCLQSIMQN
jgi:hypothetical protein